MAVITEPFNGDGTNKNFTVSSTILSKSHVRVDFFYDDVDHEIASSEWDVLSGTILFKTAPLNGWIVRISVSSDGEGLDTAPSDISDLSLIVDEIETVADNINDVITNADEISNIVIVGEDLSDEFVHIEDLGNISDPVDSTAGTSKILTVASSIDNVNNVSDNIDGVNYYGDIYYGAKAVEPTTRNDGSAMEIGDMYFNSSEGGIRFYTGVIWSVNPVTSQDVAISKRIGTVVHTSNSQLVFDHTESSGISHGCDLTDNLDGTVDISAGEAFIRATDDSHSTLFVSEVIATVGLTIIDNFANIVYLDYNSGTPIFLTTADPSIITVTDKVPAFFIFRDGNTLHIRDIRGHNIDNTAKHQKHMFFTEREVRSSGGVISDAGTLHVAVTASSFYFQLINMTSEAIDTSGTDTYDRFYSDGASGWTKQSAQTIVDNTYYDDGSGTLAELGVAKYAVEWFYLLIDTDHTELVALYGTESYNTIAGAENANAPADMPNIISGFGVLIGKTIVQKSGTELIDVLSAFEEIFTSSLAQIHNNLAGLNDGEYKHMTTEEQAVLQSINTAGEFNLDLGGL